MASERRGLSFVEILIACAILAVAFVAVMSVTGQGTRSVAAAGKRLLVASLARVVIEDLKVRPFDDVSSRSEAPVLNDAAPDSPLRHFVNFGADVGSAASIGPEEFPEFVTRLQGITYAVEVSDDTPMAGLKTVTVKIFESAKGGRRESAFTTVLMKAIP